MCLLIIGIKLKKKPKWHNINFFLCLVNTTGREAFRKAFLEGEWFNMIYLLQNIG